MAVIQDWVDDLHIEVPEAVEPTIARAVRFAVQEFFRESESWRHRETIYVFPGVTEYSLGLPTDTTIFAGDFATFTRADGSGRSELTSTLPERVDPSQQGDPATFYAENESVFINPCVVTGNVDVGVILVPTRTVAEVPDELANRWFEAIRSGALLRLLTMPGKNWTDVKAAAVHEATFRDAIAHAKRAARKDRSRPKRRVRYGGLPW